MRSRQLCLAAMVFMFALGALGLPATGAAAERPERVFRVEISFAAAYPQAPKAAERPERVFRVEVDFWCPAEFGNFEAKVYRTDGVEILEASPEKKVIEFKVKAGKALDPAQVQAAAEDSGLRVRKIEVREIK